MGNAIVRYFGPPKKDSWCRWMLNRTRRQNKNNLIAIVGKTGSGKTYSAMSICETMSEMDGIPFTIDHVVFSLKELMYLINSDKVKKGSRIVFDEPQISISVKEFQSKANKVFNYLLSTFRHRNFTLIFCTPYETLLDKSSRRLFHATFNTRSININKKTCRLMPRYVEFVDYKAEPYRKRLIVMYKNSDGRNSIDKLDHWDVSLPSKTIIDLYEEKKYAFTDNLNKNILKDLEQHDEQGKSMTREYKAQDDRKPLSEKQIEAMVVLSKMKTGNRFQQTADIIGISFFAAHKRYESAIKKGYRLEEFENEPIKQK